MVFAKVDTEAEPELAAAFGIMSIPTRMVFRDQIVRLLVSIGTVASYFASCQGSLGFGLDFRW
jgi:hypothetical protein